MTVLTLRSDVSIIFQCICSCIRRLRMALGIFIILIRSDYAWKWGKYLQISHWFAVCKPNWCKKLVDEEYRSCYLRPKWITIHFLVVLRWFWGKFSEHFGPQWWSIFGLYLCPERHRVSFGIQRVLSWPWRRIACIPFFLREQQESSNKSIVGYVKDCFLGFSLSSKQYPKSIQNELIKWGVRPQCRSWTTCLSDPISSVSVPHCFVCCVLIQLKANKGQSGESGQWQRWQHSWPIGCSTHAAII